MNLLDLFAIPLAETPAKPALRFRGANGIAVSLSYAELYLAAERVASGFAARGLVRGDRIAFFLGNRPEFVIAYLAAIRLGAIVVPINLAYRKVELAHILLDAEPRLLLTERDLLPIVAEVDAGARGSVEATIVAEEIGEWPHDPAPLLSPPIDGSELAFLLYTSGTTGRSKGAEIRHDNLLATITGLLAAWAWESRDVLLLALPLFHTHGLVVGLHCALAAGATVELRRRFEAAAIAADLTQSDPAYRPTLFFGVPTMYVRLVEALADPAVDRSPLARMRLFCSGSAPLAPETFEAFRELSGHAILERYGMTEAGMILSNPHTGERRAGTVGTPLPGISVRLVRFGEGSFHDVTDGEEGELIVRGGNVFDGYWRAPEKTAESFVSDSKGNRWFKSGDLARRDPVTGAISLLGRSSELILAGGFNVYPREIEEVLLGFPGVREAAVVGRPHSDFGAVPVAFLVVEPAAQPLDPEALIAFAKERIASFKVPREIRQVDSLPRNALGKVQKHLLPR